MRHLYPISHRSATDASASSVTPAIAIIRSTILPALLVTVCAFVTAVPAWSQQASTTTPAPKHAAKSVSRQTTHQSSASVAGQAAAAASANAPAPVSNDSYNLTVETTLRDAPSSGAIGQLQKSANVEVLAHDRGWTRVRIDGWVPDSVLMPADTTYRSNLSAADLRVNPDAARGKMVVWDVQFLAIETADPLRHGLADGEPYILARGPNSENALLYLVVPPSLMGTARALQPLARISVTARVRDGRSDPVGIPILDIQTLRRLR